MKKVLMMAVLFISIAASAQVKKVTLQASGLTCSMCSNAINKSLRSLEFVENVSANIKTSTFEIAFKPNANVDFDMIKKKVEAAGFFVSNFVAVYHFDNENISNDQHAIADGRTFHFLKVKQQNLNGDIAVRLLDKGFVSAKEYKKNGSLTTMACYKTGIAEGCCVKPGIAKGSRIYHVTI